MKSRCLVTDLQQINFTKHTGLSDGFRGFQVKAFLAVLYAAGITAFTPPPLSLCAPMNHNPSTGRLVRHAPRVHDRRDPAESVMAQVRDLPEVIRGHHHGGFDVLAQPRQAYFSVIQQLVSVLLLVLLPAAAIQAFRTDGVNGHRVGSRGGCADQPVLGQVHHEPRLALVILTRARLFHLSFDVVRVVEVGAAGFAALPARRHSHPGAA